MDKIYRKTIREYFQQNNVPESIQASLTMENLDMTRPCIGIICSFTGIGILQSASYRTLTNRKNHRTAANEDLDELTMMDEVQLTARLKTMHRQMAELGLVVIYLKNRIKHEILSSDVCNWKTLRILSHSIDLPIMVHLQQFLRQFNVKLYNKLDEPSTADELIAVIRANNPEN